MSSDHSTLSSEKSRTLLSPNQTHGTLKVKYRHGSDWDFHLENTSHPVDLCLILPHYRARCQPVDHRMSMFVGGSTEPIKLKVCRNIHQSQFALSVFAETSDVTVWLPSDFKGQCNLRCSGKPTFSSGFVNKILQNVRLNEPVMESKASYVDDSVIISTQGRITLRMWDVRTCSPENCHKETLKRIFGCSRKTPETAIDWDCLLTD